MLGFRQRAKAKREIRAIRECFASQQTCPRCESHDVNGRLDPERDYPVVRWKCAQCGDFWSNFYVNGQWGWYHDRGIAESLKRWADERVPVPE